MSEQTIKQRQLSIIILDNNFNILYVNEHTKIQYPNMKPGDLFPESFFKRNNNIISSSVEWPGYGICTLLMIEDSTQYCRNVRTSLYEKEAFLLEASRLLSLNRSLQYCMVAIDIEHFKLFNEWYGEEKGDLFLEGFGNCLTKAQVKYKGLAGYMGSDDFVILLPFDTGIISIFENEVLTYARQHKLDIGFRPVFGIYPVKDRTMAVSTMYDRAMIALTFVKGNYALKDAWYEDIMKEKMEDDQILLSDVQRAIEADEFVFYVQPKCSMLTGKIVGLESLVRWNHPIRGIIQPGTFLPLLEQSGLITSLDLHLWEMVCSKMKSWIDRGYHAVPVSVNVSRIDIYSINIPETFHELAGKYGLDPSLIEIEITESSYVNEHEIITEIVDKLKAYGFAVLMDDFGSGYSSLNMLKDVDVDILKMDMMFLHMDKNSAGRGKEILKTIVRLASDLHIPLIAEGVETKEQSDFLLSIGCLYAQGSYYYSPLSVDIFESLLADNSMIDYRGIV